MDRWLNDRSQSLRLPISSKPIAGPNGTVSHSVSLGTNRAKKSIAQNNEVIVE